MFELSVTDRTAQSVAECGKLLRKQQVYDTGMLAQPAYLYCHVVCQGCFALQKAVSGHLIGKHIFVDRRRCKADWQCKLNLSLVDCCK